jgi:hypothetical protein
MRKYSVCELRLVAEWHRRDAWSKVDFKEADRQSLLYAASESAQIVDAGYGPRTRRRYQRGVAY